VKNIVFLFIILLLGNYAQAQLSVEINVDATNVIGQLEPFWASQIIHPTEFLLTEWGDNFLKLLEENGAAQQYIRIYNQPEQAIRVSSDGVITYDWNQFDAMADLILATGNKIHVVFYGMPYEIAAHPEATRTRPYGAKVCFSPPKDYQLWEDLCIDFSKHVVAKYGLDEIKKWNFRCWNEPDLSGFWYKADLEEYLKLYDHFSYAVKSVNKDIKVGGPALSTTNTYKHPEHFSFFLEHIVNGKNYATKETGSPIDFLSVHTYGGSGGHGGPGREYPDVEYMMEQEIRLADMRDEFSFLKHIPINVEEWGISSGGTKGMDSEPMTVVRNSEYGAAFLTTLVAKHIKLQQENDRNIRQFTFCSSGYEKIPEHDFMGYRTFDTKSGFQKPILNAYKLLFKLAPEMVKVEKNNSNDHVSAFATCDEKRITIVVTNFQNERINNDGEAYPVSLAIESSWQKGTEVTVKHWRIDASHSNAYTAFKKLGSPALPNPLEIDAIKSRMQLELLENPKTKRIGDLKNIEFQLPCNSVSLVEITKK
jgi:xylan 1,4-beta-xylosidase